MVSLRMVVLDVLRDSFSEGILTNKDHLVQAFALDGRNEGFGITILLRASNAGLDSLYA